MNLPPRFRKACLLFVTFTLVGVSIPIVLTTVLRKAATAYAMRAADASQPNPCPAINFQSAQSETMASAFIQMIVHRVTDGTFTMNAYYPDVSTKVVTPVGTFPNIDANFTTCAGLPSRPRKPVAANFKSYPLGVSSRNPVIADLGAGVPVIGIFDQYEYQTLLVQYGNPDLSPKPTYAKFPVPPGSYSVVVADFNGDGNNDVGVVYTGASPQASVPGGIAILLGKGDGTLRPPVLYATGANAWVATAFDWNQDGKADLAVGDYQGHYQILLGQADGTMRTGASYTTTGEGTVDSMAAADVNGDHIPDLLVLTDKQLHIMFGKGDGTFVAGPVIPTGGSGGSVGAGDFNLDGNVDIAIGNGQSGTVQILQGAGNGTFTALNSYSLLGLGTGAFFVGDFDGDGFPDLIFGSGHPDALMAQYGNATVAILFGNGDGTFAAGSVFPVDGPLFDATHLPTRMAVADFNGDGKPDIVTSNAIAGTLSVAMGRGAGAFKTPVSIPLGSVQPAAVVAADFTGDGKADVVATDGAANIVVLTNSGDGTFLKPILFPVNGTSPKFLVAGDFNGDKKLDLVTANAGSSNISILTGNGDGSFHTPVNIAVGSNPVGLVTGDFNGDGKLDLAVANAGTFSASATNLGSISLLLGKGDGTFQTPVTYSAYQYPTFITAIDVNGDRNPDLLVASKGANGTDKVAVLLGNGNGTFQSALLTPTAPGPTWISAADFTGDGKPDVIVTHCCSYDSTIAAMVGKGDGTFLAEVPFGTGSFASSATADFNGDGKPDVAFTNAPPGFGYNVTVNLNVGVFQGSLVTTSAAGNPIKLPPVAPDSIVTDKGTDLATGVQVNSSSTPPTSMLGTTVTVQDAFGGTLNAQLFYVSPSQVNFLMPAGMLPGTATITITSGDGFVSVGTVVVAAVAPAIFTLNSNSLAAAYVQRVHGDNTQSIENIYAVDAAGNVIFPPIDLGPSTDQVYLNIYGTGIRARNDLSSVTIKVGGVAVPALYAGPSGYPGEDQVSILLPRSLVGAGTVTITLSANGIAANSTTLNIK